jgi:hypothetical protein
MDSQRVIDTEKLLPSSLLEELHNSDNESDSNTSINFNQKLSLFNEEIENDNWPNQVIYFINLIIFFNYRRKKK